MCPDIRADIEIYMIGEKTEVLWYFPEHKIAIISITYVHRSVSQHIEKSLK